LFGQSVLVEYGTKTAHQGFPRLQKQVWQQRQQRQLLYGMGLSPVTNSMFKPTAA
jgi:hypothetical protein